MVIKQPITEWWISQRGNRERNKTFLELNENENTAQHNKTKHLGHSESSPKRVIYSSTCLH